MIGVMIGSGSLIIGAIIVAIVSERAANGTLKTNDLAGIRVKSVMASEEAWQAGHAAARQPMRITVGLTIACALAAFGFTGNDAVAAGLILVGSGILLAGVLLSARRAIAAAESVTDQPPS